MHASPQQCNFFQSVRRLQRSSKSARSMCRTQWSDADCVLLTRRAARTSRQLDSASLSRMDRYANLLEYTARKSAAGGTTAGGSPLDCERRDVA